MKVAYSIASESKRSRQRCVEKKSRLSGFMRAPRFVTFIDRKSEWVFMIGERRRAVMEE
jgi:hypothetical protein